MAADDEKLERLTDLILVLLRTPRPLSLEEIVREVPGYPDAHDAYRQAFERDKRLLREEGIFVTKEAIDGPEQFGYRIDPAGYFLPDLALSPEEQAALNLAVAAVDLTAAGGGDALRKLGVRELAETRPIASLGAPIGLDRLYQAIASKAEVRFTYLGEPRTVSPWRLRFAGGHWYLAGWSKERDAGRNFRVDRIEGKVSMGSPGSASFPEGAAVRLDLPDEPWTPAGETLDAEALRVVISPVHAWRVAAEVGSDRVVERHENGAITVEIETSAWPLARSWILSFLEEAEVVSPKAARDDLVAWVEAVRDQPRRGGDEPTLEEIEESQSAGEPSTSSATGAQQRLRRLLAMLSWLADVGSAPTADVAERFSMTPDEVIAELELAACCGVPPYSPGELMDIIVDADVVEARLPELARPRQLTASEGVALAAAARMILSMPGSDDAGPLARALDRLEGALGDRMAVEVDIPNPPLLGELQKAVDGRRQLEVEYLAASTDELTTRVIDPLLLAVIEGRWYLVAECHRAGARRTFRADLFKSVRDVGSQPEGLETPAVPDAPFTPTAEADLVFVKVDPEARWIADSIPSVARRFEEDGGATVVIAVAGRRWFERVLLQAGAGASVIAPRELLDAGRHAAERVLRRYQPTV